MGTLHAIFERSIEVIAGSKSDPDRPRPGGKVRHWIYQASGRCERRISDTAFQAQVFRNCIGISAVADGHYTSLAFCGLAVRGPEYAHTMGEDEAGELYFAHFDDPDGQILRIESARVEGAAPDSGSAIVLGGSSGCFLASIRK